MKSWMFGAALVLGWAGSGCRQAEPAAGESQAQPAASAPVTAARPETPAASTLPVLGPAPAWTLSTPDGRVVNAADFKGKIVVVDFWATWCPPCRAEIPGYSALQKKYAEQGVVVLGLSLDQDGAETVRRFASAQQITYTLLMADEAVVAAFGGIEGIPTTFLIDREGRLRHKKVGAMEAADYEKLVASLLP